LLLALLADEPDLTWKFYAICGVYDKLFKFIFRFWLYTLICINLFGSNDYDYTIGCYLFISCKDLNFDYNSLATSLKFFYNYDNYEFLRELLSDFSIF
jgi:hypothetical protein